MIKVGIIEDDISLLKNLNIFLGNFPDLQIVFSFCDFTQFKHSVKKEKLLKPDIILVDYIQTTTNQSLDVLPKFLEVYPRVKFLVYTEADEKDIIVESIMFGANGFLLKSNSLYDVYSAIKACCEYGGFISSKAVLRLITYIQRKQLITSFRDEFKGKQREITTRLQQGLTYEEISHQLGITKFTVNYHVQKIFKKMMVKSRTELVYKLSKPEEVLTISN